jgi:hypothetical protein
MEGDEPNQVTIYVYTEIYLYGAFLCNVLNKNVKKKKVEEEKETKVLELKEGNSKILQLK